jgi:hypothetical protein
MARNTQTTIRIKNQLYSKKERLMILLVAWKDIPTTSGDMQKDEMTILWRDAFKEVTPDKMKSQNLTVIFDKETSDLKGK